jgi:hypothetical protein
MAARLVTYLQDHLAGARFAVTLLEDLVAQEVDLQTADVAKLLLPEIEKDQNVLQDLITRLNADRSTLKEATAWLTQKASRAKLNLGECFGIFESVELLSLGVLGKKALWKTLRELREVNSIMSGLDVETLVQRAERQHERLEQLRLSLCRRAFDEADRPTTRQT